MLLTLDLTPAEEDRLTAAARLAGVGPAALLKKFVDSLPPSDGSASAPKNTFVRSPLRGLGMFAHVPGDFEQFALEKQAEIDREESFEE